MPIRRSKGKARPELPRAAELKLTERTREPNGKRDALGRFGAGNELARGRGWKRAVTRMIGRGVEGLSPIAAAVAEDAWRIFAATLREMPDDGPTVRARVASMARHQALESYYSAQAIAALGTPEGREAEERATFHAQRAERLSVTALDLASRLASARPRPAPVWMTAPASTRVDERDACHEDAPGRAGTTHTLNEPTAATIARPGATSPPRTVGSTPGAHGTAAHPPRPHQPGLMNGYESGAQVAARVLPTPLLPFASLFGIGELAHLDPERCAASVRAMALALAHRGQIPQRTLDAAEADGWRSSEVRT